MENKKTSNAKKKTVNKASTTTKKNTTSKKNVTTKKNSPKKSDVLKEKTVTTPLKETEKIKKTTKANDEIKKNQIIKSKNVNSSKKKLINSEYGSIVTIVIVVLLIIVLAVGLATIIKNNEKNKNKNEVTSSEIQYDEILIGKMLDQTNGSYYVFIYSKEDMNYETYNTYLSSYKNKENSLRVYTSSLENGFNKKFISEDNNLYVSNINDFKINGTTLVKVESGSIVEAYTNKDDIISHLK